MAAMTAMTAAGVRPAGLGGAGSGWGLRPSPIHLPCQLPGRGVQLHPGRARRNPCLLVTRAKSTIFEDIVPSAIRDAVSVRPADSLGVTSVSATGNHVLDKVPGLPRPTWMVMAFSLPTAFLWYGWYKFVVEEEIKAWEMENYGGECSGYGGYGTLGPFTLGLLLGPLAEQLGLPGGAAWSGVGVAWIYYTQYLLYRRVNALYASKGYPEPLHVWWLLFPGFNLIIGLRQLHFLAEFWTIERGDPLPMKDPVAAFFPFIQAPRFTVSEFLKTPALWLYPLRNVTLVPDEDLDTKDK